jgi:D-methionine transport system ATP-binding protein
MIEICNLSKTFPSPSGAVTALTDVSLAIGDGEIFGIIGLSGAGKSTLVRCINLLERPTSGAVLIDGNDLTALPKGELLKTRRNIGMIFQSFNLLAQRTALGNVLFPLEIAGVERSVAKARARELLALVGLSDREKAYPSQLSGGQKQRVAIARALATRPKYLLCDEATSALDPNTTRSILELLREINKTLGVTIVVITHEMGVIESICDRVAVIDSSRIAEVGGVRELFTNPRSDIAKQLILPRAKAMQAVGGGAKLRLVFNGEASNRPVVANLVLACQVPVNILFADMKEIDGRNYGHMLLQLPEDPALAERAAAWLAANGIPFTKEA